MRTLADSFGRSHTYLRIAVTDRCNLRCAYCMPPSGIQMKRREDILRFDEIVRLVGLFAELDVRKVRITGGEPAVRKDIDSLIAEIAGIHGIEVVGMTTNGVLLEEMAHTLKLAGLTNLNVSLDTLRRERFARITRRDLYPRVCAGIEAALDAGFTPLKLNVVVMGGVNDDEILDFVEFAKFKPVNVRFIEYMPFKFNGWCEAKFVARSEVMRAIEERYRLHPLPDGNPTRVATDYSIAGFSGTVSFIGSMSQPFCGTCNRLRLTADGCIMPCLFSAARISLREAMREGSSDDELTARIRDALLAKPLEHPPLGELERMDHQSMVEVGG